MKAIVHDGYGPPEDLQLREIEKPLLDDNDVLIRVRMASVNPYDWRVMRGEPRASATRSAQACSIGRRFVRENASAAT
jgi:NADPH:quinone reductase-like Zn-dependent oxidoreductase